MQKRPNGLIFLRFFFILPELDEIAYDRKGTDRSPESGKRAAVMNKGEQTRKKIVEAAAPIFNQRGYEGSSLNDLMEATGLKKGGIYRHFANKEELAAEAFDYAWEAARNARLLHVDEAMGGIEKLKQIIANFVDRKPPVAGGCPILNTAIDADDGNPVLRTRVGKALRSWLIRLQSIVEEAERNGEIRTGVDPKALATFIVASLEGALMISRLQRNDEALRSIQSHLNRHLDWEVAKSA
jgi:TetR/AcrR family transcriptional regulator, transcriptional repressor for nem operon